MKLLGTNAKLEKMNGEQYLIAGLSLAPHNLSGYNVCAEAGSCRDSCVLEFSGRRVMSVVRDKARRDTRLYFENRAEFMRQLNADIALHIRRAESRKLTPLIRLNTGSDLNWDSVISSWPGVTFYDYTKIRKRFRAYLAGQLPSNYYLTFSRQEGQSQSMLAGFLRRGGNIAQVFNVAYNAQRKVYGELPAYVRIQGQLWPVIDGDTSDIRLPSNDGRGVIVGLRLKGTNAAKANARATGFAL